MGGARQPNEYCVHGRLPFAAAHCWRSIALPDWWLFAAVCSRLPALRLFVVARRSRLVVVRGGSLFAAARCSQLRTLLGCWLFLTALSPAVALAVRVCCRFAVSVRGSLLFLVARRSQLLAIRGCSVFAAERKQHCYK